MLAGNEKSTNYCVEVLYLNSMKSTRQHNRTNMSEWRDLIIGCLLTSNSKGNGHMNIVTALQRFNRLFYQGVFDAFARCSVIVPSHLRFTCSKSPSETLKKGVKHSKLTIKTPEHRHWRRSGVFIVNFKHISYLFLWFLLVNLNK